MMRFRIPLALLALTATALAGCTAPGVGPDTFTIETHAAIEDDDGVTLRFLVAGDLDATTDHVGGHYWYDAAPTTLSAAGSDGGCVHQAGDLPGDYTVACVLPRIGTAHVYAHARVTDGDEQYDYWGADQVVEVKADADSFTLTAENLTVDGGKAEFDLTVDGAKGATTDHVGGHYWTESTDAPTVAGSAGGCVHAAGEVPGTFHVTCDMGEGTWHYRGHLRVQAAGETWNYWTQEMALSA